MRIVDPDKYETRLHYCRRVSKTDYHERNTPILFLENRRAYLESHICIPCLAKQLFLFAKASASGCL